MNDSLLHSKLFYIVVEFLLRDLLLSIIKFSFSDPVKVAYAKLFVHRHTPASYESMSIIATLLDYLEAATRGVL